MSKSRSRRRSSRGSARPDKTLAAPAYIKREIPFYAFLDEENIVRLEDQADWIIQEVGLEFRDDPAALEIWKKASADVTGTRVRAPKGMIRELCQTAPTEFIKHSRNPDRSVKIGGNNVVFGTVYGPPFVRDLENGRRYGTLEDLQNLVKLTYMLPSLHHGGHVPCEPCDIPVTHRHLDICYAHMKYSDKPFFGAITEKSRAQDLSLIHI